MVAQRIQGKQYKTVDDLEDDFALLFNNACTFNEPGSRIFKDARTLKKLVQLRKGDLLQILNAKKSVRLRWVTAGGVTCVFDFFIIVIVIIECYYCSSWWRYLPLISLSVISIVEWHGMVREGEGGKEGRNKEERQETK